MAVGLNLAASEGVMDQNQGTSPSTLVAHAAAAFKNGIIIFGDITNETFTFCGCQGIFLECTDINFFGHGKSKCFPRTCSSATITWPQFEWSVSGTRIRVNVTMFTEIRCPRVRAYALAHNPRGTSIFGKNGRDFIEWFSNCGCKVCSMFWLFVHKIAPPEPFSFTIPLFFGTLFQQVLFASDFLQFTTIT